MDILATNHNPLGSQNRVGEFGNAEATFLALLFTIDRDYLRIANLNQPALVLAHREIHRGQPDIETYLRSRQTYTGCAVHGLDHVLHNLLELAIEDIHRHADALEFRSPEFEDRQKHKGKILVGTDRL